MNQDKIKNRIDFKTLTTILGIQTVTFNNEAMVNYVKEKLSTLDVTVQEDEYGNIYVVKGEAKTFPCVISHMDTVHAILDDVNIFRTGDTLFAFDPKTKKQVGIGGDDKVGVYVALQLLEDIPNLKVVFFKDEENGCIGSTYSIKNHKEWYKDCGYVLMADRRGSFDVVTVSGGIIISSPEFLKTCDPIFKKYNYKDVVGISSDVDSLTFGGIGISTVNLSCGYHEPHSSKEIVSISDVNRCYNLMYDILIEHPDKKFTYHANIPTYKHSYSKHGLPYHSAKEMLEGIGPNLPIQTRQTKLFSPLVFGYHNSEFDLFLEHDSTKSNKKMYSYKGVKSLPLTSDIKCTKCNEPLHDNVFYLPYEGRMYCTRCNYYVNDAVVPKYLKYLEVDDKGVTFVYSLYSVSWIKKDDAIWNEKLSSWVLSDIPF